MSAAGGTVAAHGQLSASILGFAGIQDALTIWKLSKVLEQTLTGLN
jgi:hypothetical protein